jgi:hypothetical protein
MAAINGVIVSGTLVPTDDTDTYPIIDNHYAIDGHRSVVDLAAMDAIPATRRRQGMLVAVHADSGEGSNCIWQLNAPPWNFNNTDWTELVTNGVKEAPTDGQVYGRSNATWVDVTIGAPVQSVNNKTGVVILVVGDISGAAPLVSPALTGTPTPPTPALVDNSNTVATTAFVTGKGYAVATTPIAGTFTKITINGSGLVTGGSSLVATDIPKTLDHTWITDFDVQVRTSRLDQMAAPTATVSMNSHILTGVAAPAGLTDAATKGYVDSVAQGLDIKASCMCASIGNLTLSGLVPIDGYTPVAGNRVLAKNQTDATQNGIYVAASGAWTRAADFSAGTATSGSFTFIENGTVNGATSWSLITPDPITIGTTALTFSQFSGAGTYLASGNGIRLIGTVFSVFGVSGQITTSASGIGIDPAYTSQVQGWINNPTSMTLDGGTF